MNLLTGYTVTAGGAAIPVHYPCVQASRTALGIAVLLSLGAHLGILFGIGSAPKPAVVKKAEDPITITIVDYKLEELDPPEKLPAEDAGPPDENLTPLPVQADLPTTPRPDDFSQPLDLSTLLERPNMEGAKLTAIPAEYTRNPGGRRRGDRIFDPKDLERAPVAMAQPPPVYPAAMRREAVTATVTVGFVVNDAGAVVNAHVVDSTHPGFDDAAIAGVSKWRFRAGMREGRYVNTRMLVPIVFRLTE